MGQTNWEMSNNIENIQSVDEIYKYNRKQQQDILTAKPWEKESVIHQMITQLLFNLKMYCRLVPTISKTSA